MPGACKAVGAGIGGVADKKGVWRVAAGWEVVNSRNDRGLSRFPCGRGGMGNRRKSTETDGNRPKPTETDVEPTWNRRGTDRSTSCAGIGNCREFSGIGFIERSRCATRRGIPRAERALRWAAGDLAYSVEKERLSTYWAVVRG